MPNTPALGENFTEPVKNPGENMDSPPPAEPRAGDDEITAATDRLRRALYDELGCLRPYIAFSSVDEYSGGGFGSAEHALMDDIDAVLRALPSAATPPGEALPEMPEWVASWIADTRKNVGELPKGMQTTSHVIVYLADRLAQLERKPRVTREAFTEVLGDYLIAAMEDSQAAPSTAETATRVNTAYDTLLRMAGIPSTPAPGASHG